jgi:hypothetical protein
MIAILGAAGALLLARRRSAMAAEVKIYQSGYTDGYVDCATVRAVRAGKPKLP